MFILNKQRFNIVIYRITPFEIISILKMGYSVYFTQIFKTIRNLKFIYKMLFINNSNIEAYKM